MKLIKFGSEGCQPCKAMDRAKTLEKFEQKHKVNVVKIDIGEKEDLAERYSVQSIPTMIFEASDGTELARDVGAMPLKDLEALYERAKSADDRRKKHKGISDTDDDEPDESDDDEDDESDDEDGEDEPE